MSKFNKADYAVMSPNESFKNKRYADWVQDWSNWFYKPYPERNNDGDVVFLRSSPLAEVSYRNEALVMVGNDSLEISPDQRVLVPIITATSVAEYSDSPEYMYGTVRSHISNGDNPPALEQVRINGDSLRLDDGATSLLGYEIETPVYQIYIPDPSEGPSLKDKVEKPIESSGYMQAVTRGYFVILALKRGEYYIECKARGMTTENGPYHVSFFYHIKVNKPSKQNLEDNLSSNLNMNIGFKVYEKYEKGLVSLQEYDQIMTCLNLDYDEKTKRIKGEKKSR